MRTRTVPLIVLAAVALGFGIYEAGASGRAERQTVRLYVDDWVQGNFRGMYGLLDRASRRRMSEPAFAAAYGTAADTGTLKSLTVRHVGNAHGRFIPVSFHLGTRVFGTLSETLEVPMSGSGGGARIAFGSSLLFPGLRAGERLSRHASLGPRGTILAGDGVPLAEGPGRTSPDPAAAGEIVGTLGPIPAGEEASFAAAGYPPGAKVGLDGLEHIFQRRLAGRPGGTLLAGRRVLASVVPVAGHTVRTTINPGMEEAAVNALAGSYAGLTVMDPRTGALLALAGIAFSDVQPPGSTMKIVTAAGLLQAGLATDASVYPYATQADVGGYILKNADNESCGGTLLNAFATSCNSVFAPLGVELGADRLVRTAEKFGFNSKPAFAGVVPSTIPSAATIGSATSVGSSAIGQGEVQASTLEMADVGATIAEAGRRPIPTLVAGATPHFVSATTPRVATDVQRMMVAVVQFGTGVTAQIPGVEVAGKTGTAELANTGNQANATQETDAWFVGYAPVGDAKVVACALFPAAGFGEGTAAPVVKQVLEAALAANL